MSEVLARLDGIVRRFGPVTALDGADLEVRAGEVHGVLGENGAGKSTQAKALMTDLQARGYTVLMTAWSSPKRCWSSIRAAKRLPVMRNGLILVMQAMDLRQLMEEEVVPALRDGSEPLRSGHLEYEAASLIIPVNQRFQIKSDRYQWIIQRKRTRGGNEDWESQTYHPSVDAAVRSLGERMVRECKTDTLVGGCLKGGRDHRYHALRSSDAPI